jgi:hypothetical protein
MINFGGSRDPNRGILAGFSEQQDFTAGAVAASQPPRHQIRPIENFSQLFRFDFGELG